MQRKQFLVKLPNELDGNKFIKCLEKKGFLNIHNISFETLRIKVLVIDDKKFFSTNATCLAALSSCGIKPISIDDFIRELKAELNETINL